MQPFDLKAALLAKHAQHVAIVHFPIALFITGVMFDFIAQWRGNKALAMASYYNLLWAAIFSVPAVLTGLLAWHFAFKGARMKGVLLDHVLLGSACTVLLFGVVWLQVGMQRSSAQNLRTHRIVLELLGILTIGLTGHLGGFLSGVNAGQ